MKLTLRSKKASCQRGRSFTIFFAFDWGPLTFIYRDSEIEPPSEFDDLLLERFAKKLIIQDPRISSPGLQFLFWILQIYGEEKGFEFLKRLKNSIQVLAPSWSNSYSLFQVKEGVMVFSYFTSPFYHLINENRKDYKAAKFSQPHPIQVEYVGIPELCQNCEKAARFLNFLASREAQKIIMEKNYMFPVSGEAMEGSQFQLPEGVHYFAPIENWSMMRKKKRYYRKMEESFLLKKFFSLIIAVFFTYPIFYLLTYVGYWTSPWEPALWLAIKATFLQASLSSLSCLALGFFAASGLLWIRLERKSFYFFAQLFALLPGFIPPILVVTLSFGASQNMPLGLGGIVFFHSLMNIGIVAILLEKVLIDKTSRWSDLSLVEGVSFTRFFLQGIIKNLRSELSFIFIFLMIFFFQ